MTQLRVGKLYQNISKDTSWPLFSGDELGTSVIRLKEEPYLSVGSVFMVLDAMPISNPPPTYIKLHILTEKSNLAMVMISKDLVDTFREIGTLT